MSMLPRRGVIISLFALTACGGGTSAPPSPPAPPPSPPPSPPAITGVTSTPVATFTAPWSMAFIPDGRLLVTERVYDNTSVPGNLWLVTQAGAMSAVGPLPANFGMLDVLPGPNFGVDQKVYLTFLEPAAPGEPRVGRDAADPSRSSYGLALATAKVVFDASGGAALTGFNVIWRQTPKIVSFPGSGEPRGKMALSPDLKYLFVTAGDRQELDVGFLFSLTNTLGKIIRLFPDGSVPPDNPFVNQPGALREIWTLGHRNQYGLAFAPDGNLWEHEMGPLGGDEFNLIEPGSNYGWPAVSYGSDYLGNKYPEPAPGDGYAMAAIQWTPVIAPSAMVFYSGTMFACLAGRRHPDRTAVAGARPRPHLGRDRRRGAARADGSANPLHRRRSERRALGAGGRAHRSAPQACFHLLADTADRPTASVHRRG